jgi:hypothetical protein
MFYHYEHNVTFYRPLEVHVINKQHERLMIKDLLMEIVAF